MCSENHIPSSIIETEDNNMSESESESESESGFKYNFILEIIRNSQEISTPNLDKIVDEEDYNHYPNDSVRILRRLQRHKFKVIEQSKLFDIVEEYQKKEKLKILPTKENWSYIQGDVNKIICENIGSFREFKFHYTLKSTSSGKQLVSVMGSELKDTHFIISNKANTLKGLTIKEGDISKLIDYDNKNVYGLVFMFSGILDMYVVHNNLCFATDKNGNNIKIDFEDLSFPTFKNRK